MEIKFRKLFEPCKMGKMELRNRIVQVPLALNYTEYPYQLMKRYLDALEERARGGVGLIITTHMKAESTIDPYPIGTMMPCIDRPYTFRTFAELADIVHMHGAKIAVQLSPGTGRHADVPMAEKWPAAASAVPMVFHPELLTRELTLDEIARLVEAYGEAAKRVELAGFDARPAIPNVRSTTFVVLIPIKPAPSQSVAVAFTALPIIVLFCRRSKIMTRLTEIKKVAASCGTMPAPNNLIGLFPKRAGKLTGSVPQICMPRFLMIIPTPSVLMIHPMFK